MTEENDQEIIREDSVDSKGEGIKGLEEIPSMCMVCGGSGITRMLMHKIPYFRELLIASFSCDDCEESNNEVTFGGEIQLQGSVYTLHITRASDLDRQIIKSDSASLRIPELDFEIPPKTQKGGISTIEGFLKTAASNLALHQRDRALQMPEVAVKVGQIINRLEDMATGAELPFTIIIDDCAGNSFIENPHAPKHDSHLTTRNYYRTPEQDIALGLPPNKGLYKDDVESNFQGLMTGRFGQARDQEEEEEAEKQPGVVVETATSAQLGKNEAVSMPSHCPNCSYLGESLTCITDIPHFKEIIIMSFNCGQCGYRSNELKGGGAIPTYGTDVRCVIRGPEDLSRDVLKSDSCGVNIPELELELSNGTLGGLYTTIEGLLMKIHKQLLQQHAYQTGDSVTLNHSSDANRIETKSKFDCFLNQLEAYAKGELYPFTVHLHDPLGNSFISAPLGTFLPVEEDPQLTVADFERSEEENDEFGLLDMNTADYETNDAGVVVDTQEVVLADRLTHAAVKGADHPFQFAMGCATDTTAGGVFVGAASELSDANL